jgi:hypothetical protein
VVSEAFLARLSKGKGRIVLTTRRANKVLEDGQTILMAIQGVVEFGTAFGTCPICTGTVSYGVRGKRCAKPEATDVKPSVAWTAGMLK